MYQQRTELTDFTLNTFKEEVLACEANPDTVSEFSELEGLPASLNYDVMVRQSETAIKNQRLIKPFEQLRPGKVSVSHAFRTELSPERAWNEALHAAGFLINFTEPGDETFNIRATVPFDLYDQYLDSRVREASERWTPEVNLMLNIGRAVLTATGRSEISQRLNSNYSAFRELYPDREHRMALRQSIQMTAVVSQTVRQAGIVDFTSENYQVGHQPTLQYYETLHKLGVEPFNYNEIINCFKPAAYEVLADSAQ